MSVYIRNILISFALSLFSHQSECRLVKRFNYDARLYEHFALDSRYIRYSRSKPEEWKDITSLVEKRNFTFSSMICTLGPGAWIFYPDKNYELGNYQIYYLVVGEHCVRSDDIDSIQPLGKMDQLLTQGVMIFEKPQFNAPQVLVTKGEGKGTGGSMIFTGSKPYQVSTSKVKVCLSPGLTSFEEGYCLVPNLKASFGMEGEVTAKENCTDAEDEKKLVVQNCFTNGVHEIYVDTDLTIEKLEQVCKNESKDDFLKTKFEILMDMWSKRLEGNYNVAPETKHPKKVKVLWKVLQNFIKFCPGVDEIYAYTLGHLMIYHLEKNWTADAEPLKESEDAMDHPLISMNQCGATPTTPYESACKRPELFRSVEPGTGFTEEEDSWFEIVNGDMFDPVIEQMWLIFNVVLPTCSRLAKYINNDWSDLVVVFHQYFLDPIQETWAKPGANRKIYGAVFHGYDIRESHKEIITCLRYALEASPSYDPIGRPQSFKELMSKLYTWKIPGKGSVTNLTKASGGGA